MRNERDCWKGSLLPHLQYIYIYGVWMYFNYLLQLSMFKDLEEGGLGMGIQRLQVNSSPLEYESAAGARK